MALPEQIPNQNLFGSFVPTNFILDVAQLQSLDVNSDEFKELLVRLYQSLNFMALSLNDKDSGYYPLNQFVTGRQYFPNDATNTDGVEPLNYRYSKRVAINFGALPNAATKSVAHGINFNSTVTFVSIYATATYQVSFTALPIPYASSTDVNEIEINVDATNVNITTGIDRTNYTITIVVLEFLTD